MVTALRSIMDRNFDIFEMYSLKNIMRVPEDVAQRLASGEVPTGSTAPTTSSSTLAADAVVSEEEHNRRCARIEALQTEMIMVRTGHRLRPVWR